MRRVRPLAAESGPRLAALLAEGLEAFYDRVLPVLASVQADPHLRQALGTRLGEQGLGPHP
jgi:hypothetical protein